MTDKHKPERIEELEKEIRHHNRKYFIDNQPEISDPKFDKLYEELRKLKPDSSVLFELIGEIGNVRHPEPMLSLDKKFSHEEIRKWLSDIDDRKYIVEPKYDGMAARYQNGTLATRGNGMYGEDISHRLSYLNVIGSLPKSNESIYGEVVIPLTYFDENLSKAYKNPRNAVVGIVKSKEVKDEGRAALLDGGVHFVLHDKAKKIEAKIDELMNEEKWEEILGEIFRTDYPIDGAVIKATSDKIKKELGRTQHHEKWQIAYKTPAERKWSKVVNIKDQVGRTGRLTNVAVIEPVNLSGATVTNVTLHNPEFVKESKIGIGSEVEIMRSGEVIPFLTNVKPSKKPYKLPKKCPICSTKLEKKGKYIECPNPECPARLSQSIDYFFHVLDVDSLGLKTIERYINEFKLKSITDFYKLNKDKIAKLDGFGEKSAEKITSNISDTLNKTITQDQLLQALGLKEIGPATSRWIIDHYGFKNLSKLKADDVAQVRGIGPVKAKNFVKELAKKWAVVKDLQKLGLKFEKQTKTRKLDGKTFAITGSHDSHSREELIDLIRKNSGEYKASITKDLDYLIAGASPGAKGEKAREQGTKVIDEKKFLKLIR